MAEDDFSRLQGDSYTGSDYANFQGGGLSPVGNLSSASTTDAATSAAANTASNTPAVTPVTVPSAGLVSTPSATKALGDAALSAGLTYGGGVIGQTAGAAMGAGGATLSQGLSSGVSALGAKIGLGTGGATAAETNNALGTLGGADGPVDLSGATGSTSAAANAASGTGSATDVGGSVGDGASALGSAGAGLGAAAAVLLEGGGVKKAATTGIGTGVGTYAGEAIGSLGGPVGTVVGGFIGGAIGGAVGGRVICTQLVKDGLISKEDQYLDMEFTFRALSHVHVRGYLFWARGWVEKMKKSDRIRAATLKIVVWRLNEIKYQLGMRDNSDWKGKIVRLVMENFCFVVGLFVNDTAESAIYKKENKHVSA